MGRAGTPDPNRALIEELTEEVDVFISQPPPLPKGTARWVLTEGGLGEGHLGGYTCPRPESWGRHRLQLGSDQWALPTAANPPSMGCCQFPKP